MKDTFSSDRYFTLFDYSSSHGRMLFRSDKRKGHKENIDIIFFDTSFVEVSTMLYGITLKKIEPIHFKKHADVNKYLKYPNKNLFLIESNESVYYIVASFVVVFENDLEFHESSLDSENRNRQREVFSIV
jgi:hypothetical protein